MRITKTKLKKKEARQIAKLVNELIDSDDFTLSVDFAKDAYALFKEEISKRKIFKGFWQLFMDIRKLYARFKIGDLMKNVDFYNKVRKFFRYFIYSSLFRELDKLDPMEALEQFLKMFQPPQPLSLPQKQPKSGLNEGSQPQKQQKKQDDQQEGKQKEEKGEGQSHKSKKSSDQKGLSADEKSLPIDMTEFKKQMPKIEKAISSGIFDKDDLQKYLKKQAGIEHKELHIGNIVNLIDKIADNVSDRELDIFYVARKKEVIDRYRREEVLKSVPYPDNEMTIRNISNFQELLKTIPTQFAYDDEVFTQKLLRKEILVRDYQSRRLKKQALYLLVDVSGSMGGMRNVYASGVALAFVRQAISEGSTYFLRFFDHYPHGLYKITTKKDAEEMAEILVKKPYSGGGTSIQMAMKQAIKDIVDNPEKFEKAEIMIITDGEDVVNIEKERLESIKVHSTVIDGSNTGLKKISETYTEIGDVEL